MELAKNTAEQGIVVLELTGSMHMGADCQHLTQAADALIREGQRRVILDLSRLEVIDSAGVGTIVACFTLLRKAGGAMRVAGARGMVETVLKLTQVHRAIEFFPTVSEAAANFPPAGPSSAPES